LNLNTFDPKKSEDFFFYFSVLQPGLDPLPLFEIPASAPGMHGRFLSKKYLASKASAGFGERKPLECG